jgi:outer membrane biogenesis lipoprotein LolB
MKTTKIILALMMVFLLSGGAMAQQTDKELKKEIKSKAERQARKEAKKLKKQGYYVAPGALPMDKQLEKAWMKQYQEDDKGYPVYFVAQGISVGETQAAAKIQATELAKLELAGQISSNIAALVENSIANQQLNTEDAASVTKTVAAAKNLIAQELGRVLPIVELYKNIGKNIEVNVRLAYSYEMAIETGKKVIRKSLEEQTGLLHEKLDKLMDF